ncbi:MULTISPECIES: ParB/RepB/Spo0J family partition protein [Leptospira]|uniref:ParB-like protein n=2 Tax=Leptospira interrogans TaxID=173 RepID=A0A0E2DLW5_LEPIR|nr:MULTISPECIES: ParB/RepB/Spo0J family partition protein [Leptospira]EKR56636.1 ParB-like protein [Leptospira interrogans str. UI 12758]EMJ35559.1 ParB-like protein [Leptospira interrogans str. FPW1039]EMN94372.1 ParB-like protein [Leptospira interrogans serovar Medanensis str. UT053]
MKKRDLNDSFSISIKKTTESNNNHNNILLRELNEKRNLSELNSYGIGEIQNIPVNEIKSVDNPRKTFTNESLRELANNIKRFGLLQPIAVRKTSEGYDLIYGERRLRAYKLNEEKLIPAIIKNIKQLKTELIPEIKLMENLHREDLSDLETALSLSVLKSRLKLSDRELTEYVNKSLSWVKHKLIHASTVSKIIEKENNNEALISFLSKMSTTSIVDLQPSLESDKKTVLSWLELHIKSGNIPKRDDVRDFVQSLKSGIINPKKNSNKTKKEKMILSKEEIKEKIIKIENQINQLKKEKKKYEKMLL